MDMKFHHTITDEHGEPKTLHWEEAPCCSVGDYGGNGVVGAANIRKLKEWAGDSLCHISYQNSGYFAEFCKNGRIPPYTSDEIDEIKVQLSKSPKLVLLYGGYGGETAMICLEADFDGSTGEEIIGALADYPAIDDEVVSEIEEEWENEAWQSGICSDLLSALEDVGDDIDIDDKEAIVYHENIVAYADKISTGTDPETGEPSTDVVTGELFTLFNEEREAQNIYWEYEYSSAYIDAKEIVEGVYNRVKERFRDAIAKEKRNALAAYHEGQGQLFQDWEAMPDLEGVAAEAAAKFIRAL